MTFYYFVLTIIFVHIQVTTSDGYKDKEITPENFKSFQESCSENLREEFRQVNITLGLKSHRHNVSSPCETIFIIHWHPKYLAPEDVLEAKFIDDEHFFTRMKIFITEFKVEIERCDFVYKLIALDRVIENIWNKHLNPGATCNTVKADHDYNANKDDVKACFLPQNHYTKKPNDEELTYFSIVIQNITMIFDTIANPKIQTLDNDDQLTDIIRKEIIIPNKPKVLCANKPEDEYSIETCKCLEKTNFLQVLAIVALDLLPACGSSKSKEHNEGKASGFLSCSDFANHLVGDPLEPLYDNN